MTPNHRIPAIVDPDGPGGNPLKLFELGAILIYLSEKTGGRLVPSDPVGRYTCLQWMMFQMGGVGPMFGQYNHFASYAVEKLPYAIERYTNEVKRLHRVLEKRLSEAPYLAGQEYSMADICTFPWIRNPDRRGIDLNDYPNVKRWHDAIASRPAVQRGVAVLAENQRRGQISDAERENLFGRNSVRGKVAVFGRCKPRGAPGRTRTCNQAVMSGPLWPIELQAHARAMWPQPRRRCKPIG